MMQVGFSPFIHTPQRIRTARPSPTAAPLPLGERQLLVSTGDQIRFGYGDGADLDKRRFWGKVTGQQKKKFWEHIVNRRVIVNPDRGVSYPAPWIDQPTFVPRQPGKGGAGQGEGKEGDPVSGNPSTGPGKKPGKSPGGNQQGERQLEHWQSPQDMMAWIKELLKLPNLKPKPGGGMEDTKEKYDQQKRRPPGEILMMPTFKRALARSGSEAYGKKGSFDPGEDLTFQPSNDFVYQTDRKVPKPKTKTIVFMERDVSASMGDEEKERSRIHAWLYEMVLRDMAGKDRAQQGNHEYSAGDFWDNENFKVVYLVHNVDAEEVNQQEFYEMHTSGGTNVFSTYQLTSKLIEARYPTSEWNVYVTHFSDGDNFDQFDNPALEELDKLYKMGVNRFSFVDVNTGYQGSFTKLLTDRYGQNNPWLSITKIKETRNPQDYADSIRTILKPVTEEEVSA